MRFIACNDAKLKRVIPAHVFRYCSTERDTLMIITVPHTY